MPELKLIKNPGYVYDLIFLFYFNFHADSFSEKFEMTKEQVDEFSKTIEPFGSIPDDLYLFFATASDKNCFFTQVFFHANSKFFTTDYDLAFVQREIGDYSLFTKKMIEYYFDDLDEEQIDACIASNKRMFEIIKKSSYDDKMKTRLYEFFIDPESYIRLLQYELIAKDIQLSSYYERNYDKILDVYNALNNDVLNEQLSSLAYFNESKVNHSNICLSFCLLNKYLVYYSFQRDATLCLFGIEYLFSLKRREKKQIALMPDQFGAAISDVNRVKILETILQKGKCTCKELEGILKLSASTTYHHLSTLMRHDIIYAVNKKKASYYYIDHKSFAAMIDYLKKFAEDSEKHT